MLSIPLRGKRRQLLHSKLFCNIGESLLIVGHIKVHQTLLSQINGHIRTTWNVLFWPA